MSDKKNVKFRACKYTLYIFIENFPHRNIHKYTWTSPDGITHSQIDHVLVDKRRQSSIIDVRSLIGADCDTDHYLVIATIRERLSLKKGIKQTLGCR